MRTVHRIALPLLIVLSLLAASPVALAQAPAEGTQRAVPQSTRIYALKYREAGSLAPIIAGVLEDPDDNLRMAVDGEGNALIVSGTGEQLEQITQLLVELDQPVAPSVSTFPGRRGEPPPVAVPTPSSGRLRIVWLVDKGSQVDAEHNLPLVNTSGRVLPADMAGVAEALKSMGVEDLRMVGQWMARLDDRGAFAVQGTVGEAWPYITVEVEGERRGRGGGVGFGGGRGGGFEGGNAAGAGELYEVKLTARKKIVNTDPQKETWLDVAGLKTVIDAPPGHPIVMGMSSTGPLTSVFVIVRYEDPAPPAENAPQKPEPRR